MKAEEILKENLPKDCIWDEGYPGEWNLVNTPVKHVLTSMERFAKEQSIAFAEWMDINGYTRMYNGTWQSLSDFSGKTTNQLYQLFIDQTNKP